MKSTEFSSGFCEEYSEKDWNPPCSMDPGMGFNAPTFPFSNFEMGQRDDIYCSSSSKSLLLHIILNWSLQLPFRPSLICICREIIFASSIREFCIG
jgi:hypothetical protein